MPKNLVIHPEKGILNFRGGPSDFTKPLDGCRIMVMGGSNTWGEHIKDNQDTFSGRLADCLRQEYAKRPIEVLNAGIGGFNLFQLLLTYKLYGAKYQPDMLILYVNFNDSLEALGPYTYRELWQMSERGMMNSTNRTDTQGAVLNKVVKSIQDVLRHSLAYNGLTAAIVEKRVRLLTSPVVPSSIFKEVNPPDEYRQNLEEFISICKSNHTSVILADEFDIHFPQKTERKAKEIRTIMREIADKYQVHYLPINQMLGERIDKNELVFSFDPVHLTVKGHEIVASELCSYIASAGAVSNH